VSAEVEGESYFRARGQLHFLLDGRNWSLTVTYDGRWLLEDEVLLKADEVLQVDDGYEDFLRAELGRSFGVFKISLTHVRGALPPAFKESRLTTLGFGVLF